MGSAERVGRGRYLSGQGAENYLRRPVKIDVAASGKNFVLRNISARVIHALKNYKLIRVRVNAMRRFIAINHGRIARLFQNRNKSVNLRIKLIVNVKIPAYRQTDGKNNGQNPHPDKNFKNREPPTASF